MFYNYYIYIIPAAEYIILAAKCAGVAIDCDYYYY